MNINHKFKLIWRVIALSRLCTAWAYHASRSRAPQECSDGRNTSRGGRRHEHRRFGMMQLSRGKKFVVHNFLKAPVSTLLLRVPSSVVVLTYANDVRMARRRLTWPLTTLVARFSRTMLLCMPFSLTTQPSSSPLLITSALLYRLQSCRCLRRQPCAPIILTLAFCGPHPLPAPRWLLGRNTCSSLGSLSKLNSSKDCPMIVLVTSSSSLRWL